MATTFEQLNSARSSLQKIEDEQSVKVTAANVAFDDDPTEKNAEKVSAAERVAKLMIAKAQAKVTALEAQLDAERRETLQAELEKLEAVVTGSIDELQPFIERGSALQQQLEVHERELAEFYARVANASTRAGEIEIELSGKVLNGEQRHSFLVRCDGPVSRLRGTYRGELEGRALAEKTKRGQTQQAEHKAKIEELKRTSPAEAAALARVQNFFGAQGSN